jgi:alpha-2-macroglobulin-like protein
MEFSDMSKVHDVDPKVIQRTQQWLAEQQQGDGSWRPDSGGINEGATNRFQSDVMRITAYVAWALEVTGYQGPAVDRARQFIAAQMDKASKTDAYTLAVVANFAVDYAKDRAFTERTMRMLLEAKTEQGDQVSWKSEQTGMYATGASAAVETTGLAVQALLKWGGEPAVASKAMNYIVASKDAAGTWGTTQATIMALRALLLSTEHSGGTATGAVEVLLNGNLAAKLALIPENNDLFHQFVFNATDAQQSNRVEIRFAGKGLLAYQVAGRYFVPWNERPASEALSIDVSYDRTRLEQDQIATATATVRNRLGTTANMVMVDLGIPPGFELLSEDLDSYREKSAAKKGARLEKFTLTPTQAILYFDSIPPNGSFKLSFRLRAKYPIRARTFASKVYEYYDPAVNSVAKPVQLEVRRK